MVNTFTTGLKVTRTDANKRKDTKGVTFEVIKTEKRKTISLFNNLLEINPESLKAQFNDKGEDAGLEINMLENKAIHKQNIDNIIVFALE